MSVTNTNIATKNDSGPAVGFVRRPSNPGPGAVHAVFQGSWCIAHASKGLSLQLLVPPSALPNAQLLWDQADPFATKTLLLAWARVCEAGGVH